MAIKPLIPLISLLFFPIQAVQSRLISLSTSNQLVDDGLNNNSPQYQHQQFNNLLSSRSTCDHAYGFIPCADNVGGYIFQIVLFQYLLFIGSKLVRDGSKKLFTMLGTGIFGASIFGLLLGLPEVIFVVISGVFTSKWEAKQMVSLGVAVYAGSIVLVLFDGGGTCATYRRIFSIISIQEHTICSTTTHLLRINVYSSKTYFSN
ncbi:hypothetical protein Leryth_022351 [Lithospermum erythrorhizon]|nr:hypothetical protein Leryth_022351 [Lithospermum erythrorhizon]